MLISHLRFPFNVDLLLWKGLPGVSEDKEEFHPWVRKIPWRMEWLPTPAFSPGEFLGQRILAGYSPWGFKESDITERLTSSNMLEMAAMKRRLKHPWPLSSCNSQFRIG